MLIGVSTAGGISGYTILGPGLLPGTTWRMILEECGDPRFQLRDNRSDRVLLRSEAAPDVGYATDVLAMAQQGCEEAVRRASKGHAPLDPWEWSPPTPVVPPPVVPLAVEPPATRRLRPGYRPRRCRLDAHRALIGVRPDREVADLAGVDIRTVQRMRERMLS